MQHLSLFVPVSLLFRTRVTRSSGLRRPRVSVAQFILTPSVGLAVIWVESRSREGGLVELTSWEGASVRER
jgi:hypothetical protein